MSRIKGSILAVMGILASLLSLAICNPWMPIYGYVHAVDSGDSVHMFTITSSDFFRFLGDSFYSIQYKALGVLALASMVLFFLFSLAFLILALLNHSHLSIIGLEAAISAIVAGLLCLFFFWPSSPINWWPLGLGGLFALAFAMTLLISKRGLQRPLAKK